MSDQQHEILSQLNDSQREAVTYCDGPSLVIAGAIGHGFALAVVELG